MNICDLLPVTMALYPTYKCQLQCPHCFLTAMNKINNYSLDFEVIKKIIEDAHQNNVFMMIISGGDPILYPHIYDILDLLKKYNILPLLGVTGVGITTEIAIKLKKYGIDYIQVSLDGYSENTNKKYRGKGNFEAVIKSIKILQEFEIKVNLAICLDKNNANTIEKYLQFALDLHIYKMKVAFWQSVQNHKTELLLSEIDKMNIKSICEKYNKIKKFNWISIVDKVNPAVYPQLSVGADGEICIGEYGSSIGNANTEKVSVLYGKYVFKEREKLIYKIIDMVKNEYDIYQIERVDQNKINAAALVYYYNKQYQLLISNKLSLPIYLFTILHEIGHIVQKTLKSKVYTNQLDAEEKEANIWAISYLEKYINKNFYKHILNVAYKSQDQLFLDLDQYLISNLLIK